MSNDKQTNDPFIKTILEIYESAIHESAIHESVIHESVSPGDEITINAYIHADEKTHCDFACMLYSNFYTNVYTDVCENKPSNIDLDNYCDFCEKNTESVGICPDCGH